MRRLFSLFFIAALAVAGLPGVGASALTPQAGALFTTPLGSSNWSGYALLGTHMRSVSGTFTVPPGNPAAGCGAFMSEWVGIDGADNTDLIQAGISEGDVNAWTGNCGTKLVLNAWREILPAPEQPIGGFPVHVGDVITVTITDVGQGQWAVSIFDQTSEQVWSHDLPYSGPASTAEWVVESPEVDGFIAPLMPYGVTTWTGLHLDGRAAVMDDIWLVPQDGLPASVPESVPNARALMKGGFTVVSSA